MEDGITEVTYKIQRERGEHFVRCEVEDAEGRKAWLSPIPVKKMQQKMAAEGKNPYAAILRVWQHMDRAADLQNCNKCMLEFSAPLYK